MASKTKKVIVPTEKELSIEDKVKCPVEGCGKCFKSSTCLLMHQRRHHDGQNISGPDDQSVTKLYYCPVEGCSRGLSSGKSFPRLGQLKQHYNGVHGNKSYVCERCGSKWGLKDVYKRHIKECGQVFQCVTCDEQFKSSNALYQHNKRKHAARPKPRSVVVSPIIVKPLIQLPSRPHSCSTALPKRTEQSCYDLATQTDLTCVDDLFDPSVYDHTHSSYSHPTRSRDSSTFNMCDHHTYSSTSCDHQMYDTSTSCDHHMYDTSTSCDFGTQTTTYNEQWLQDSALGYLQYTDFGTQTLKSAFDDIACLDFGTQTIFKTKDQGCQT